MTGNFGPQAVAAAQDVTVPSYLHASAKLSGQMASLMAGYALQGRRSMLNTWVTDASGQQDDMPATPPTNSLATRSNCA